MTLLGAMTLGASAQRVTDKLTRGIVAVPQGDKTGQDSRYGMSGTGVFVSWRILPTEYYDTKYNLYRDGSLVAAGLTVSNYQDDGGSKTSTYRVVPVVKGVEQTAQAAECKPWDHQYWEIPVLPVVGRDGNTASGYTLNDCSVADVDGDGQMEFVVKRRNDSGNLRQASNKTQFNLHECYKMDGTRLWWIDMGPNLMAGPDEQFDLILYDWDQDGKAEAVMRGADNMIIHTATGKTINIGNMQTGLNSDRPEYMGVGKEYLLYLNGETGEPYGWNGEENWTPMDYPLPQFESGESYGSSSVWGDLGHRMQKHYFGAPYLDGRNAAIFLGRGCYTRHKFCALEVNKETHELKQLWRWNCYDGSSPWFGNGFHNFAIADVDCDGRDEIVFGSMIIDDTGYGLATTGYGHGDAQHCGDLDPYRWGLEQFVCLESAAVPGIAYTGATKQDLRYTTGGGSDNGRCMAGNFFNSYPGAVGISGNAVSLVADKANLNLGGFGDDYVNMRVYWDGDLLDEFMDSPGVERAPTVYKAPGQTEVGTNRSYENGRCWMGQGNLNNSSKNNPCFLGDIIGDWREEIVTRTADKLIIQTTSYPSPWGFTSLWYDHEYRNAMTWQSVGYNQPPHVSFFLGEMEDITVAPPAITLEGRTEVANGGTIQSTDAHLLVSGYEDKTISVSDGASPYILTVNAPAWLKGSGSRQATASTPKVPAQTVETFTTTLTGGAFSGATRLVKQGEGVLVLPNVVEKHTGETDVWQGTLQFDGTLESSPLWLNRHTTLISNGGQFKAGIKADYNATIYVGGKDNVGTISASKLQMGFGSRLVFDVENGQVDQLNADSLLFEVKSNAVWQDYGPQYKEPIFEFVFKDSMSEGTYDLANVNKVIGNLDDIVLEGLGNKYVAILQHKEGKLQLVLSSMRLPATTIWNDGTSTSIWRQANLSNYNFVFESGENTYMAYGDSVVFDDRAGSTNLRIKRAVSPRAVSFNNETKAYTVNGDSIVGGGVLTKNGAASLTLNNVNRIGEAVINGGRVTVTSLANSRGQTWGSLGGVSSPINLNDGATLQANGIIISDQVVNLTGEATIDVPSGKSAIFNKAIRGTGSTLVKTGAGSFETGTVSNTYSTLVVKAGTVTSNMNTSNVDMLPATVQLEGGVLWGANLEGGSGVTNRANFVVPAGKTGEFHGSFRGTYSGKLTGEGTFKPVSGGVRCYWNGDWSAFEGTIQPIANDASNRQNKKSYTPTFNFCNGKGIPNATLNLSNGQTVYSSGPANGDASYTIPVGHIVASGTPGTLAGAGSWIIGLLGKDMTSQFKVTTTVTKRGAGIWRITTPGNITGAVIVEDGVLQVNTTNQTDKILNSVTLKKTAEMFARGYISSLTMESGTQLTPRAGNLSTPGTLKASGTMNVKAGATVNFRLNSLTSYSKLDAANLTMNGTVTAEFGTSYTPKAGDTFTLWTVSGTFSGTPVIDLPQLPEGLYWDTRELAAKSGVLKITDDATVGISTLAADSDPCNVYDLSGRLVSRQSSSTATDGLPAGIYVRGGKKVVVK